MFDNARYVDLRNSAFIGNYHANPAYNFRSLPDNVFAFPDQPSNRIDEPSGTDIALDAGNAIHGWKVYLDANGHKYYHRRGQVSDSKGVVNDGAQFIDTVAPSNNDDWEEFMTGSTGDPNRKSGTLYIDHSKWYASPESDVLKRSSSELTPLQVYDLQIEYWKYIHQHPSHRPLPRDAVEAAKSALHCFFIECLYQRSNMTAPFSSEQCKELLAYLNSSAMDNEMVVAAVSQKAGTPSMATAKTALVSYILYKAAAQRRLNNHGAKEKGQEFISPLVDHQKWGYWCIASICFGVPYGHLESLIAVHSEARLRGIDIVWPEYIGNLSREWSAFNLAATVLLSSSVGFLAVPGLDSTSRIASLLSIVFTLGSVVTGVYLLWSHNNTNAEYHISDITPFRSKMLSVILSLPFATLTWGVLTFLVAVVLFAFGGFQPSANGSNSPMLRSTSWVVFGFGIGVNVLVMIVVVSFFQQWRFKRAERRQRTPEGKSV